jgi:F0F1-type ATP synthase assembly protein I
MFLVIILLIQGAQVVFGGQSSEVAVGFMIGTAAMLTELFFVLMCIFFVIGQEAQNNGIGTFYTKKSYNFPVF